MQCSNCQFENMPGVRACGRCGASLQLASLSINVHPPRAGRLTKFVRRWFPLVLLWNRLTLAIARSLPGSFHWPADVPPASVLLRAIVPGWSQSYLGRVRRGKWMFWGYLGLLLSGLLFAGTFLGWTLLGLAMSLHAASVVDIVAPTVHEMRLRLGYAAATLALLTIVVYYPAGWLLAQVATPQRFATAAPPFEAGDVVLVSRMAYNRSPPEPGDVVLYQLAPQDIGGDGHVVYRIMGERIDRVIARAGQKVTCSQGKLLVDGEPSAWLPLSPQPLPEGFDITVPKDYYLIIPSADALPRPMAVWRAMCIVPRGQIGGRVYWQSQPLWRFGPIR
jgi:hypothetical protein